MNFIRGLIEIPIVLLVIVLAVVNDCFVTFSLKFIDLNVTLSLSLLILALFVVGYLVGRMDGYFSNAPLRSKLRKNVKAAKILNKEHQKLGKEHEKLNANFSHLKEDLEHLKVSTETLREPKVSLKSRFVNAFHFKKN